MIIDRFEGEFAVIETSNGMINVPKSDIPINSKEGDVLIFQIDQDTTLTRKKNIESMMNHLFND